MQRGDDLKAWIAEVQAQADDCSHDANYVSDWAPVPDAQNAVVVMYAEDDKTVPDARREALAFSVVQMICIHRANGGRGQGIVTARWTDNGLELAYRFATSPTEVFHILRSAA